MYNSDYINVYFITYSFYYGWCIMSEKKCAGCFAHRHKSTYGWMCTAPVCIKEADYNPETRMWVKKSKKPSVKEPTINCEGIDCNGCSFHFRNTQYNPDCFLKEFMFFMFELQEKKKEKT